MGKKTENPILLKHSLPNILTGITGLIIRPKAHCRETSAFGSYECLITAMLAKL
jgi:hypothetical protein